MRAQLESLVEATERPNVRLQVMPFHTGRPAAAGRGFVILRVPHEGLPPVVYLGDPHNALVLDKGEDVERYVLTMERLCIDAEPARRTREIPGAVLREYDYDGPDG